MNSRLLLIGAAVVWLASGYLVGPRLSAAQGPGPGVGSIWEGNATYVSGSVLHVVELNQQTGTQSGIVSLALPRGGEIADVCARSDGAGGIGVSWLLYGDGSLFEYTPGTGWRQIEDLAGGSSTAGIGASWGQVKDRYRK